MTEKGSELKSLSVFKLNSELNEILNLYDAVDLKTVRGVYDENYGYGDNVIFDTLCVNSPGLREANERDKNNILELLEGLHRKPTEDVFYLDEKGRRRINYETLLDNLTTEYTFKTLEDTEHVLVYDNGIYRPGVTVIKEYVETALGDLADMYVVREIIAHIQRRTYTPRSVFNTDTGYVPVLNGLLNLDTLELESFDPGKFYTYRLPVEYNPDAGYSHIETFFNEVLESEDIPTMQEAFGYCLYPEHPAHKMFWWLGRGRNGKTTTGHLLSALIGADNTAGVPLKQLDGNHRFAVARLYGKLLNVVAEPETKSVMQTPTLKSAVGGDLIFGEKKGVQDVFSFVNFAKFVVYANKVPKIEDESFAFWERVIAINYPHEFKGTKAEKNHHKTIIKEDGLSGLLNWALVGLKRLKDMDWEFSNSVSQTTAKLSMKRQSQPVTSFVEEWTEFDRSGSIPKEDLFDAYKIYCDVYELLTPNEGDFTKDLKRSARVKLIRPRSGSHQIPAWRGIKIKDTVEVVISVEKDREETETEKRDNNKDIDEIELYKLSDFLSEYSEYSEYTFLHATIIGVKTVISENKEIIPLYKSVVNTSTHLTHPTQKKLSGLESGAKMRANCELCGKLASLSEYVLMDGTKVIICPECVEIEEEVKRKRNE